MFPLICTLHTSNKKSDRTGLVSLDYKTKPEPFQSEFVPCIQALTFCLQGLPTAWLHFWTRHTLTKAWNLYTCLLGSLVSAEKMLISLQAAACRLESLCILHAKICISALFLIQEFQTCTIQIVLTRWLYSWFKICKRYIHLSSFTHIMWPRPWSDTTR